MGKCFTVFHLVHFGTFSPSVNTIFITRVPRIHKSGIPTAILPPCSLLSLPCWALGRDLPHQSAQCAPQELSSMAALEVHRSRYWCRCPSEKPTFSNSTIAILISSNFNIWAFLCWLISRSSCCRLGAKIYQSDGSAAGLLVLNPDDEVFKYFPLLCVEAIPDTRSK